MSYGDDDNETPQQEEMEQTGHDECGTCCGTGKVGGDTCPSCKGTGIWPPMGSGGSTLTP